MRDVRRANIYGEPKGVISLVCKSLQNIEPMAPSSQELVHDINMKFEAFWRSLMALEDKLTDDLADHTPEQIYRACEEKSDDIRADIGVIDCKMDEIDVMIQLVQQKVEELDDIKYEWAVKQKEP